MLRFLPHYMEDLQRGAYTLPGHTEQSLRNIFTMGAMKEYFYERMPSMANPLGWDTRPCLLPARFRTYLSGTF